MSSDVYCVQNHLRTLNRLFSLLNVVNITQDAKVFTREAFTSERPQQMHKAGCEPCDNISKEETFGKKN